MKVLMDRTDTYKLRDVTLAIDIENNTITIVASRRLFGGADEVLHVHQFSVPNKETK